MAKFITTKQITSELEELIKNADERLYIVSPYLKLSKDFRELLTYRDSNRKDEKSSMVKPSCYNCYNSNKNKLKFPLTA